jgi:hypothetical protein
MCLCGQGLCGCTLGTSAGGRQLRTWGDTSSSLGLCRCVCLGIQGSTVIGLLVYLLLLQALLVATLLSVVVWAFVTVIA